MKDENMLYVVREEKKQKKKKSNAEAKCWEKYGEETYQASLEACHTDVNSSIYMFKP